MAKSRSRANSVKRLTGHFFTPRPTRIRLDRILRLVVIFALLLLVIGFWTNHAVRESLNASYAEQLETILDADITALKLWMNNEKAVVAAWAAHPHLRDRILSISQICRRPGDIKDKLLASPDLKEIGRILYGIKHGDDFSGFAVIDRMGRILVSSYGIEEVGQSVDPERMTFLAHIFQGKNLISRPEMLTAEETGTDPEPTVFVASPVSDGNGEVVAALVFLVDPEKDFSKILSVARIGDTGETYAFDNQGILLSESRFSDQLRAIGVIDPNSASILTLQIRDPGGNLLKGYKSKPLASAGPLTKMAAAAITGVDGVDLKGYRNYRGANVIGAWRWLEEFEFGVATEVESAEAYSILRPLRRAFVWLFCVLIAASAVIAFSSYNITLLKERIEHIHSLGQYTLEEKIGEGGMGIVYKARHAMLRRPTALKMLKPESMSEEAVARFEREVQLTSQLTHPNTVDIYDFGLTPNGIFYYVMEYLPGANLAQLMQIITRVEPARVIHIVRQACGSLEEAHSVGLVHRDIKPQNILLCQRGGIRDVVKVLDFGLVKSVNTPHSVKVTAVGMLAGTPLYISPERLKDPEYVDARSDIYSIGAVMFNLLTGRNVFTGSTAMDICTKAMTLTAPRVSDFLDETIPPKLDQLVADCLARDPAVRPQTATEVSDILNSIDLPPWTQKDARQWWEDHLKKIKKIAGTDVESSLTNETAAKLTVDKPSWR